MDKNVIIEGEASETDSDEEIQLNTPNPTVNIRNISLRIKINDIFSSKQWQNQSKGQLSQAKPPNQKTTVLHTNYT